MRCSRRRGASPVITDPLDELADLLCWLRFWALIILKFGVWENSRLRNVTSVLKGFDKIHTKIWRPNCTHHTKNWRLNRPMSAQMLNGVPSRCVCVC